MRTALFTHPACLDHDTGPWHPESPARLRRVLAAFDHPDFAGLDRQEAPLATDGQLMRVHDPRYVAAILALRPEHGELLPLDGGDTLASAGTVEAARRAAGGATAAVEWVCAGRAEAAFVATRPPGHHAERGRAMGFCLFASAAVAARHAIEACGMTRVAILDFDVHHGNGTQEAAWDRPDLFYGSSHQSPCFPGTGAARERGASGNLVNVPLPPGTGSAPFRAAWERTILPAADAFAPDLVIVSAGFDAHAADPLANLQLGVADFVWLTGALIGLARARSGGRIVSILEGGYDLSALAESAAAHVRSLLRN